MTSSPHPRASTSETATGWALRSFDPWDPRVSHADVWDMYRAMRQAGPVVHSDAHGGFWSITTYDDVRQAAADFKTFSSQRDGVVIGRTREGRATPLELDRPVHTRYRRAMQEPFFPRRIGAFTDLVRACVRESLDRIAAARHFDIVHDLAEQLPFRVISDFLGIPRGERQVAHRQLATALINADLTTIDRADEAYEAFLREEVRARRATPGEDFVSELCRMEIEGSPFDDDEVARMARALALAGHHTTINGISSLLLHMADPENRQRYLEAPDIGPLVVEETLRVDPPIHLEARSATVATVVGGTPIPEGGRVALLYASGNHDEQAYADPERFDPLRGGPTSLSFGHGIHKCLGAPLARLEMGVVLEEFLDRFPDYGLTGEPDDTGMFLGHHMGWESIPATVTAG